MTERGVHDLKSLIMLMSRSRMPVARPTSHPLCRSPLLPTDQRHRDWCQDQLVDNQYSDPLLSDLCSSEHSLAYRIYFLVRRLSNI